MAQHGQSTTTTTTTTNTVNMVEDHSRDHLTFEMLLRISFCPRYMENLGPQDMDRLGEEIATALQQCAVPESQVSIGGRRMNEQLLSGVATLSNYLKKRADDSAGNNGSNGRAGAFHLLFRKTVITSTNVSYLFRMCDPAIRTGYIRQQALMILALFSDLSSSCWSLIVPGDDGQPPMSYAKRQIVVMANALLQKGLEPECTKPLLTALFNGLMRPIGSESPKDIIELVNQFDWPTILQDEEAGLVQDKDTRIHYVYSIFILLHAWVVRLLTKDRNNEMAKAFLREKLGSCHKLLRTCLRRLIHEGDQMGREIQNIAIVIMDFMNCLVPVPVDRETNALVRRAKTAFEQALLQNKSSDDPFLMENARMGTYNFQGQRIKTLIHNMGVWQLEHRLSDEVRWENFQDVYLLGCNSLAEDRRLVKDVRKKAKKKVKQEAGLTSGEMCANCFVLEKTLLEEAEVNNEDGDGNANGSGNGGLMKCSRCLQIKYCSVECQREHWKKAHKHHCKVVTTTKSSVSASKKS